MTGDAHRRARGPLPRGTQAGEGAAGEARRQRDHLRDGGAISPSLDDDDDDDGQLRDGGAISPSPPALSLPQQDLPPALPLTLRLSLRLSFRRSSRVRPSAPSCCKASGIEPSPIASATTSEYPSAASTIPPPAGIVPKPPNLPPPFHRPSTALRPPFDRPSTDLRPTFDRPSFAFHPPRAGRACIRRRTRLPPTCGAADHAPRLSTELHLRRPSTGPRTPHAHAARPRRHVTTPHDAARAPPPCPHPRGFETKLRVPFSDLFHGFRRLYGCGSFSSLHPVARGLWLCVAVGLVV